MSRLFSRDGETLKLETRRNDLTSLYVVSIHESNGQQTGESFSSPVAFRERLKQLEAGLEREHWIPSESTVTTTDDWPVTAPRR